jgi:hypothetical protein
MILRRRRRASGTAAARGGRFNVKRPFTNHQWMKRLLIPNSVVAVTAMSKRSDKQAAGDAPFPGAPMSTVTPLRVLCLYAVGGSAVA